MMTQSVKDLNIASGGIAVRCLRKSYIEMEGSVADESKGRSSGVPFL